ncbi:MAG: mltB [Gammaproteobacteria bacterium]|nr:mltB [Gammaproteobacteria bacterium]
MTRKKVSRGFLLWICLSIAAQCANAAPSQSTTWQQWLAATEQEAVSAGVSSAVANTALNGLTPDERVLGYDKTQPESRLSYKQYRQSRGDDARVRMGVNEYRRNAPLLNRVARTYGVSPCVMVSLWGMETSYGHYVGSFPVIRSLATLAFYSDRSDYFHEQLIDALQVLNGGHIDNAHYVGEWAGASGQPQFMPASFQKYAVDYDGDGRKNIWTSLPDVFASIANYLVQYGWQANAPWGYEVNVPAQLGLKMGENNWYPVSTWQSAGVTLTNGQSIPDSLDEAVLIMPDGGPGLLAFHNFFVLKEYNNSTYYAGTVSHMANAICQE